MLGREIYQRVYEAILQPDPGVKCELVSALNQSWLKFLSTGGTIADKAAANETIDDIDIPGRPDFPELVHPRDVPKRAVSTPQGKLALLHSFAHIEFNAINLALDAVYRFREMPQQFISDWLLVADEEAKHFTLLNNFLIKQGTKYGAFPSHNGLWDMVCKTRHDVLHRMALVPRVMEARGLDVTPKMIQRFEQLKELEAAQIMRVIYQDEIGHVKIGNHWYQQLCAERGVDAQQTFRDLINQYFQGKLRGPFNWPARLEAGFSENELRLLGQSFK